MYKYISGDNKMKKLFSIMIALFMMCSLFACDRNNYMNSSFQDDTENYAEEICERLGCEYEMVTNAKSVSSVMKKYKALLSQGETEGFTPLIIIPSEILYDVINDEPAEYDPKTIIEEAAAINAEDYFSKWIDDEPLYEEYDIVGEFMYAEPMNSFSLMDYFTGYLYANIIIAKIPTNKPWELAAWVPMGGFNECPAPEEQVAIFKYWYEKYGALPAVVSYDTWEMYVAKPIKAEKEAMSLAMEQFIFCGDIVWQGSEQVGTLAGTLINSKVWYFWWD
jgi:hypothetical protein